MMYGDQYQVQRYTQGLDTVSVDLRELNDANNGWIPQGQEMSHEIASERLYYIYDEMGSPLRMIGEDGKTYSHFKYDEFGRPESAEKFDQNWSGPDNVLGYTGYQYDYEAGLYYAQARYYNPEIGRFTQQDTYPGEIVNPQSLNLYAYCGNNPLIFVDPSGHKAGDLFNSQDAAAEDFGKTYNKSSSDNNKEWFGYIVKTNNGLYTYTQVQSSKSGQYQWNPDEYKSQEDYSLTSAIHTHAKFRSEAGDSDLRFSCDDESWSNSIDNQCPLYLANAAGELLKYDPKGYLQSLGQIFLIKTGLPRQPNVPNNLTGYHPMDYKKHSWYYYIAPWHWGDDGIYRDGYK